jgi:hypothetical protein
LFYSLRHRPEMFSGIMSDKLQRWVGIAAVLNLAMIALLSGRPQFSNASRAVRGISNPILAMEVARNVTEVDSILSDAPSPDREVMRIKQYADFAFIGSCAALFLLLSVMLMREGRLLAISAALLTLLAAVVAAIENVAILRILDVDLPHTTQAMIDGIRDLSLVKWALASLVLGLIGILLLRTRGTGLRVVGALDVLAALLGLYGQWNNAFLQLLGFPMLGGLVGLAVLYFRPRRHARRNT